MSWVYLLLRSSRVGVRPSSERTIIPGKPEAGLAIDVLLPDSSTRRTSIMPRFEAIRARTSSGAREIRG